MVKQGSVQLRDILHELYIHYECVPIGLEHRNITRVLAEHRPQVHLQQADLAVKDAVEQIPAPVNISVKRLKFRLSGSARKSQKRFRDTPTFKIQAVLARIEPFQRSNERSERGDHPV
jgi:hypothetical protein